MKKEHELPKGRKSEYPVHPLILSRWSPRAMTGEELSEEELFTLFEAARWAPSSYNGQPWKFIYAKRERPHFATFFDLLSDFNKSWCKNAGVLVAVASRKSFEKNGKPARTHSFDTGAAWENLALQAAADGLVTHGMEGFDFEKAAKVLQIPNDYQVEAMIAIGKRAKPSTLPHELQEREAPGPRKEIREFIREGSFQ